MRSIIRLLGCVLLLGSMAANVGQAADTPTTKVLTSFEPADPAVFTGPVQPVKEHATAGEYACKLESKPDSWISLQIADPAILRAFASYSSLKIDIFNPQDRPVTFFARIDDSQSTNYGSRFNKDDCIAPPGKSTFEIDLTSLTCSNARNFAERRKIDTSKLKLVSISMGDNPKTTILFMDNVRLSQDSLPKYAWLKAFDFGPAKSAVYSGFESANEDTPFADARGWGWVGPVWVNTCWIPDSLTRDCACANEFRIALPNGSYEVNIGMDPFGMWGDYPGWLERRVYLNGREVLNTRRTPDQVGAQGPFAHEDDEDLPGQNLWDKFIATHQRTLRQTAQVTDGVLSVRTDSDSNWGKAMTFMVVYPTAQEKEGRQWMDALDKQRRESFAATMVVTVPPVSGQAPVANEADKARGFIAFVRHAELDIPCNANPDNAERNTSMKLAAARGERADVQVGLYPLSDVAGVTVTASDLASPDAKIPAASVKLRKVRNFLKRSGSSWMGEIKPFILQDFKTLDLHPGTTRGLWVTVTVPADARPGKYSGNVTIGLAGKSVAIPVELTVYPFTLDKVTDITVSVTGTRSWGAYGNDDSEAWWQRAEVVMRDLADHGMNAVTGGPGATLKGIRNGKADIDYTRMDRWLALAVKYGLTMPGDSYQGLDISGIPGDYHKDCIANNEKAAKDQYGVSYAELLKTVYGDVERHGKEKGWPKRVFSFLDEPRPEYSNIEPAAELIRIRTAACPDALFSGYYSTGDGRDVYFQTMPISIAHTNKLALDLTTKAGKQLWDYDGGGARHNIGRWCFVAARAGLKGYLRNGYGYVCSDPYFDFTDDEAAWTMVFPSRNGISDTPGWERSAQGANDYRYLLTCERLINKAKSSGKAAAEASAASAYMAQTLKSIELENRETARLSPAAYDQFRTDMAGHIIALTKALGE